MGEGTIYGAYLDGVNRVMEDLAGSIEGFNRERLASGGEKLYEHLTYRVKGEESMREKLIRNGHAPTPYNALRAVKDAVGLRVVCLFIDDVYDIVDRIKALPNCTVVNEKDYIRAAKPNGYRSYHMILDVETDFEDADGQRPGHYFAEVQLRTIAMDTWAALEHELKYKKDIGDPTLVVQELRRCANELAACDVSMQALRRIIREM